MRTPARCSSVRRWSRGRPKNSSTSASKAVCSSSRTLRRATSSKTSARGWSDANSSSISARARSVGDTRPATGVGPPSCSRRLEGTYARCAFTPGTGRHPQFHRSSVVLKHALRGYSVKSWLRVGRRWRTTGAHGWSEEEALKISYWPVAQGGKESLDQRGGPRCGAGRWHASSRGGRTGQRPCRPTPGARLRPSALAATVAAGHHQQQGQPNQDPLHLYLAALSLPTTAAFSYAVQPELVPLAMHAVAQDGDAPGRKGPRPRAPRHHARSGEPHRLPSRPSCHGCAARP